MRKIFNIFIIPVILVCALILTTGCSLADFFKPQNPGNKEISRIELTKNIKTAYLLDDLIDLKDAKLRIVYNDETTNEIEITATMLSGFNTETIGNKTLTITYAQKTTTVPYTVKYLIEMGTYDLTKIELYDSATNQLLQTGTEHTNGHLEFFENKTCKIVLNEFDPTDTIHNINGTWQIDKSNNTIIFNGGGQSFIFDVVNSSVVTMTGEEADCYYIYYFQYEA